MVTGVASYSVTVGIWFLILIRTIELAVVCAIFYVSVLPVVCRLHL